mmetsp:Transcript_1239/g.1884  ORF Transcript_1239/g.1884 Transcript_1239/m.1884 type:complete len:95 (-) Transcript_1239:104-388(-)
MEEGWQLIMDNNAPNSYMSSCVGIERSLILFEDENKVDVVIFRDAIFRLEKLTTILGVEKQVDRTTKEEVAVLIAEKYIMLLLIMIEYKSIFIV